MTGRSAVTPLMLAVPLALAACATARLHSTDELNSVGRECGLALGELVQDESEKKLLLMMRIEPTREQRACVARWARRNHLHTVFIDTIKFES